MAKAFEADTGLGITIRCKQFNGAMGALYQTRLTWYGKLFSIGRVDHPDRVHVKSLVRIDHRVILGYKTKPQL